MDILFKLWGYENCKTYFKLKYVFFEKRDIIFVTALSYLWTKKIFNKFWISLYTPPLATIASLGALR